MPPGEYPVGTTVSIAIVAPSNTVRLFVTRLVRSSFEPSRVHVMNPM